MKENRIQNTPQNVTQSIPLKGIRKIIAARMMSSLQGSAQLTHMMEADITSMMEVRKKRNEESENRISVTDILIAVVAKALSKHKHINGWIDDTGITFHESVHMGVAVSLDDGLIVPVLKNAEQKSITEISVELKELSQKAREGKLRLDECTGSTFTITNLGSYRLRFFTPIINEPEIAILGVGGVFDSPLPLGGEWIVRKMLPLSLTYDHRAIDGAPATAFLQDICEALEGLANEDLCQGDVGS